jgi:hypothetical protein
VSSLFSVIFLSYLLKYSLLIIKGSALPPPVESRDTSGKAPLHRGCLLIYTRNIHRDEIPICLLEVG